MCLLRGPDPMVTTLVNLSCLFCVKPSHHRYNILCKLPDVQQYLSAVWLKFMFMNLWTCSRATTPTHYSK